MSDSPAKPHTPNWRKEKWATLEAKKQDRLELGKSWDWDWEKERETYDANPTEYIAGIQQSRDEMSTKLRDGIASHDVILAEDSGDPRLVQMQETIDTLACTSGRIETPPKLVIHKPTSYRDLAKETYVSAAVMLPTFVEINELSKDYFLEHPDQFKYVMAHELAHIANGDRLIENMVTFYTSPPNQKREILAERMGAIIHGNPAEHAKASTKFQFHVQSESSRHIQQQRYLSANGNARMLHKWADILKAEGATDPQGNIIMDRALEVFERSKAFTEDNLKIDQAINVKRFDTVHTYSDPAKLAKLLGIETLPDFLTQEPFQSPFEDVFTNSELQQNILENVNRYRDALKPATVEELKTVFELVKIGMHYTQHKTGEDVYRNISIYDSVTDHETKVKQLRAYRYVAEDDSYILTFKRIADWVDYVRLPEKSKEKVITHHAPRMGLHPAVSIVVLSAEEAHHAVTYTKDPTFYKENRNGEPPPIPYFKDPLELAFGKFLPEMVHDFGFEVTQTSIRKNLAKAKGTLSDEEYIKLYRERLEERYGFKLPGNDDSKDILP